MILLIGCLETPTCLYMESMFVLKNASLHRHRKGVGSIPAGGPIVDEFFSTVPG